jgi:hypothetical protein
MLAGALWLVRRYNIRLPGGSASGGPSRRLQVVERTPLDGRRSLALLRRDGREHLILLAPEGNLMIETGIVRDDIDHAAEAVRLQAEREAAALAKAEAEAMKESFAALVEKARAGVKGKVASVTSAAGVVRTDAAEVAIETAEVAQAEEAEGISLAPISMAEAPASPPLTPASEPAPKRVRTRAPQQKRTQSQPAAAKRRTAGAARD